MYKNSNIDGQRQPPSPMVEIDDHIEFEVEEVFDSRIQCGRLEYLAHWRRYDISDRT